jgi:plastocyanin
VPHINRRVLRSARGHKPEQRTSNRAQGCESGSVTAPAVSPVEPSASPAATAGAGVKIVEPPFRPPQEWTYSPGEITVKVGTQIVWTNTGAVAHTVTADDLTSFDSGTIDPKATFKLTPAMAGTFAYHCTFHPWMKATLVVSP